MRRFGPDYDVVELSAFNTTTYKEHRCANADRITIGMITYCRRVQLGTTGKQNSPFAPRPFVF